MDNHDIVSRFEHLESERKGSVEQIWDEVERYVLPLRSDFYSDLSDESSVDWDRRDIYDSTAVYSCSSLAASIQGNLVSMGQRWFELTFRRDDLNEDNTAKEWLEETSNRIYRALDEANFDVEIAESFIDLVGYGSTIVTEEVDDDGKLIFSTIPIRECYFEEDHNKQVYRVYRYLSWTPVQILSKFGEKGTPEDIKERAESPSGSTETEKVIFCIYPRKVSTKIDTGKPIPPEKRPFGFKYILKSTAEILGDEGGYYEMPAFVARWLKTAGSKWGHSPSIMALADIRTLNQLKEATLEAAGKAIDPAVLAEDQSIIGDLDLERGGLTIVNDIDGLRPFESGSKFDVSNLEINMLTNAIRSCYLQDKLELKESPAMTATEVNVRYELMQKLLGPVYGRIKTDLLDPLIQRTFNILYRNGELPEVPENLNESDLDVEYTGPLALAQRAQSAQAITQFLSETSQLAQMFPEILDIIDVDTAVREVAIKRGVPAKVLRPQEEVDQKRKAMQQQQQMQEQMAMMQQGGDAAQSIGKGVTELQAAGEQQGLQAVGGE